MKHLIMSNVDTIIACIVLAIIFFLVIRLNKEIEMEYKPRYYLGALILLCIVSLLDYLIEILISKLFN